MLSEIKLELGTTSNNTGGNTTEVKKLNDSRGKIARERAKMLYSGAIFLKHLAKMYKKSLYHRYFVF